MQYKKRKNPPTHLTPRKHSGFGKLHPFAPPRKPRARAPRPEGSSAPWRALGTPPRGPPEAHQRPEGSSAPRREPRGAPRPPVAHQRPERGARACSTPRDPTPARAFYTAPCERRRILPAPRRTRELHKPYAYSPLLRPYRLNQEKANTPARGPHGRSSGCSPAL
jgi:hypothetical protein